MARDPRSREYSTSRTSVPAEDRRGGRDPTESLNLLAEELADFAAEDPGSLVDLATGSRARQVTLAARQITGGEPAPTRPPAPRRTDDPNDYLGGVLGSYRVLELLGKGGMGYVFRAEHVRLGREVALKLLRADYASRRDAVARFFQEARTVNRVRHRNIVDVTDFVELDDGTTFIIMEMLSGTSLGAWAKAGVELPRALAVLAQICDGLAAAHQVGVIHRDLKPDNVIVLPTHDGAELVKLLDFGVAKLVNPADEDVGLETAAGSVIGTPAYMSPEQAGGMLVDARSDIYALGAIMYEMFCGQPMFRGRSFGEYVRKHLTESPVPPRQTAGGAQLAPELEAVILRCVDKDPDHRFADIAALRDVLLGLLATPIAEPNGQHAPTATVFRAPAPWPALTRRWPRVLGGAVVLALGGAAAFWLAGPRQASPGQLIAPSTVPSAANPGPPTAPGINPAAADPSPPTAPGSNPVAASALPVASPAAAAVPDPVPAVVAPAAAPLPASPGVRVRADAKSKSDMRDKRPATRAPKQTRKPARPAPAPRVAASPPAEPAPAAARGHEAEPPARERGDAPATVLAKPPARPAIAPTDTLDPFRNK